MAHFFRSAGRHLYYFSWEGAVQIFFSEECPSIFSLNILCPPLPDHQWSFPQIDTATLQRLQCSLIMTKNSISISIFYGNFWYATENFWAHLCSCHNQVYLFIIRDQNGFRPKSLKGRNAKLGGVCTCLLNEPQMKHTLPGGSVHTCPPPEIFWLLWSQMVHSSAILGHCTPIPLPSPL